MSNLISYIKFVIYISLRVPRFLWFLLKAASYKHVKKVSKQVRNDRVLICFNCPSQKFDEEMFSCKECKCIVILKAEWANDDCPLQHWPRINNLT